MFKGIVDAARAKLEGLSSGKNPADGKKIISGGKKKPVDVHVVYETAQVRGIEKRRLEAEAALLWNVYFTKKKTIDASAERDRENAVKAVAKKSLTQRLKDKKEADHQRAKAGKKADAKSGKKVDKKSVADKATSTVKKSSIKGRSTSKKAPQGKITKDKQGKWRDERGRYAKAPKKDPIGKIDKLIKGKQAKGANKKSVTGKVADKVKKSGIDIDRNKVAAEASIFWHVYYKIKARKEPKKDIKGKTKISQAKKAGDKVKGAKKGIPVKGGPGGFWRMLTGFFKLRVLGFFAKLFGKKGLIGLLGKGLRFAGRAAMWGGRALMGLSLPVTAVAVATAVAAVQVYRSVKAFKAMRDAQEDAKTAQENLNAVLAKAEEVRAARIKNAEAAGDTNMAEQEKIRTARADALKELEETNARIHGGAIDQLDLRGTWLEFTGIVGTNEEEQLQLDAARERYEKATAGFNEKEALLKKERMLENARRAAAGEELLKEKEDYSRKEDDLMKLERSRREGRGLFTSAEELTEAQLKHGKDRGMDAEQTAAAWREQFVTHRAGMGLPPIEVVVYGKDAEVKEGTYAGKPAKVKKPKKKDDFVDRPGEPAYSFNSEDTLLGFKKGGPIINLIRRQAGEKATSDRVPWWKEQKSSAKPVGAPVTGAGEFGKFQLSEIKRSNVYLKQLVELTAKMLQRGPAGQGGKGVAPAAVLPANNSIQGNMGGPTYTDSRSDFHASAYSMHTPPIMA